jgi:hypothetical protein
MGEIVSQNSYFMQRAPSNDHVYQREKQSVALVIAMGGLYPCPDIIEAILDPTDGQPKAILDIG